MTAPGNTRAKPGHSIAKNSPSCSPEIYLPTISALPRGRSIPTRPRRSSLRLPWRRGWKRQCRSPAPTSRPNWRHRTSVLHRLYLWRCASLCLQRRRAVLADVQREPHEIQAGSLVCRCRSTCTATACHGEGPLRRQSRRCIDSRQRRESRRPAVPFSQPGILSLIGSPPPSLAVDSTASVTRRDKVPTP